MGAQSFIMMYQAGEGWQYGKRKISAMSNEEFNKLTPELVLEKQAIVLRNALPTIQKSMDDMTPMIRTIIAQYGDFIREMISALPEAVGNIFEGGITGIGLKGKGAVSGSIGALAPLIPRGAGSVAPITSPFSSTRVSFYSITQLKAMSNVQIVDLRNQINSGAIVVHSGTRTDIQNEINSRSGKAPAPSTREATSLEITWDAYEKEKVRILAAIIHIKKSFAYVGGRIANWNKSMLPKDQLLAIFKREKKGLATMKTDAYRFFQQQRNSSNHLVKADANRMINSRLQGL